MEDSLNSHHVNNSVAHEESSGWTGYFEDFLSNQRDENSSSCDHSFGSPSLVSDAASYIPLKASNNVNQFAAAFSSSPKFPKKLNFKKTRTKEIFHDDSLEDTASSPVNSPKVSSLKQMEIINPTKRDDIIESSLVKGSGSDHYSESQISKSNEMIFYEKTNDTTDLKKRGLCLVPLSMLVNYVG